MNSKRHVNLLYNKEILEKRKHFSSIFRSVVLVLGIITVGLAITTTIIGMNKKSQLASIQMSIATLKSQLNAKAKYASTALKISNKAHLIQEATSKELPYGDYYKRSLAFLPKNIVDNYLKNIEFTPDKEGLFEFDLENYEMLHDFIKDVELKKSDQSLKAYKINKINVKEGTPSSSIVQLKIQF